MKRLVVLATSVFSALLLISPVLLAQAQRSPPTSDSPTGSQPPPRSLSLAATPSVSPTEAVSRTSVESELSPIPPPLSLGPDAALHFTRTEANGDLVGVLQVRTDGRWRAVSLACLSPSTESLARTTCFFGFVYDLNGGPAPGVTVHFTSPAMSGSRTATTDSLGRFCASHFPPGYYRIFSNTPLYRSQNDTVLSVRRGFRVPLVLTLDRFGANLPVVDSSVLSAAADAIRICPCIRDLQAVDALNPR